jgi:hypothetical protein
MMTIYSSGNDRRECASPPAAGQAAEEGGLERYDAAVLHLLRAEGLSTFYDVEELSPHPIPKTRIPSFFALTTGWAVLSFHLIVLGCTLLFTLQAIVDSFGNPATGIAFSFYIWFGSPVLVGWTAFMFLKSVLAEGRGAAKLGLLGSLGLLGMWAVMLAVQFGGTPQKI